MDCRVDVLTRVDTDFTPFTYIVRGVSPMANEERQAKPSWLKTSEILCVAREGAFIRIDASLVADSVEYTRVSKLGELQIIGILFFTVIASNSEQLPKEAGVICVGSISIFKTEFILACTVSILFAWYLATCSKL